jgi:hypothetical protein
MNIFSSNNEANTRPVLSAEQIAAVSTRWPIRWSGLKNGENAINRQFPTAQAELSAEAAAATRQNARETTGSIATGVEFASAQNAIMAAQEAAVAETTQISEVVDPLQADREEQARIAVEKALKTGAKRSDFELAT